MEEALEDRKIVNGDGKKSGLDWSFHLKLRNVKATFDLSAPPRFRSASRTGFVFELPGRKGWNFALASDVKGQASVKEGGTTLFSWSPSFHVGLRIDNLKVVAEAKLDSARPNRPKVVGSKIQPSLSLAGSGFLPVSVPISFTAKTTGEKIELRGHMTGVDLKDALGALDAKLTADLVISVLPRGLVDLDPSGLFDFDFDDIPLGPDFRTLKIQLRGQLRVRLERVGRLTVPFPGLEYEVPFPSPQSLDEAFAQLSGRYPLRWGDEQRAPMGPAPDPATLATPVAEVEAAAARHMPHGAILSFDYGTGRIGRPAPAPVYTYGADEDSAIWTGHYLAAESFRYAATKSPQALARVRAALGGIERLFAVTGDLAVVREDGKERRVPVTRGPGILSRTAKPTSDPIPYTTTGNRDRSGPLEKRPCHYLKPEGGWRAGRATYPTYARIPEGQRRLAQPVGTVWYGWGCGTNHPVSRDQYVGVMMGLGLAWQLVPDVRAEAGRLVEEALDYLLRNRWNVVLPPGGRIETTFLGDFPKQLAFLRIGKTVNPGKYADEDDQVAAAAELA